MPYSQPEVRRVWPVTDSSPRSDEELLALYDRPAGGRVLRVNCISSLDGSATLDGLSGGLGDVSDQLVSGLLRVVCDAIVIGAGTIRTEGYGPMVLEEPLRAMRLARGETPAPVLAIVTRHLKLDPSDAILADAPVRPTIITTERVATEAADRFAPVADVLGFGADQVDLGAALAELARRGAPHVLCEGGPHLLSSMLEADLVDELCLTLSPKLVGAGSVRIVAGTASPVRNMALRQILVSGNELFLHYTRAVAEAASQP